MSKTRAYTIRHLEPLLSPWMPKKPTEQSLTFGQRLAAMRKAAGFTQQELGDEIGVSRRMIAYYEGQSEHPPTTLLPDIAKALRVSTDELLGLKALKKNRKPDTRLQRRMHQIEKMGAKEKRQILQLLDTFIEREQLKQKSAVGLFK